MRADFQQDSQFPILQIILYCFAALGLSLLLYSQYKQGMYSLVLTSALAIPALIFSAIYIFINRHIRRYLYVNYPLVGLLALLSFYQLPAETELIIHYVYALPILVLFSIPIFIATIVNLALGLALFLILLMDDGFLPALRTTINFYMLFGVAWSFVYLTIMKGRSFRRLALTDHYSGAFNYRHFVYAFQRELKRSHSAGKDVSLIAFLIDDYAVLNDIYGQQMINVLLPNFVDTIQQLIRTEDEVYRLAPDMFVLLLPNCAEQNAQILMERIKKGVSERSWEPINELSLSSVATGAQLDESAREIEQRLQAKLKKRRLTILQMSAFSD